MTVSKRTRFEVFKRDGFACQYCGAKPPDATLHADHIIPRKEGGGDEIDNLATACQACNLGKGAKLLKDRASLMDLDEQAAAIVAREEKLRAYNDAKQAALEREQADFRAAWNHWFAAYSTDSLPHHSVPWESVLKGYVRQLGVVEVKDAIDVTAAKFDEPTSVAVRYLGGVLRRKVADVEGRIVACCYCRELIVLERGQDPARDWYHSACLEALDDAIEAEIADVDDVPRSRTDDAIEEPYDDLAAEAAAWDALIEEAGV